jgi:hypothetical protein
MRAKLARRYDSEFFGKHTAGGPPADMLYHIDVGNEDLVILCELLELFGVEAPACSVAHDNSVFTIVVNEVKHICTHPLDLKPVDLQYLVGVIVKRRIRQLYYEVLALLLELQGGHAHDRVVVQEGHHAVCVIDHIAFSVMGRKSHGTVRPF